MWRSNIIINIHLLETYIYIEEIEELKIIITNNFIRSLLCILFQSEKTILS